MTNRLERNECLWCGTPLLDINAQVPLCSQCMPQMVDRCKRLRSQGDRARTRPPKKVRLPRELR
jgi:predicted RNA-binding Zn-ribbon protein involved in translation (DUF1610 family)